MNVKKKVSKESEQNQAHRYRELFDGYWRGGGLEGWVGNVKGLRSTDWLLWNRHGDIKYLIGNIVNNSLITMYGARGASFIRMIT